MKEYFYLKNLTTNEIEVLEAEDFYIFGGEFKDHILYDFYEDNYLKIGLTLTREKIKLYFFSNFIENWNNYKGIWSDLKAISYSDLSKEEQLYVDDKILEKLNNASRWNSFENVKKETNQKRTNQKTKQVGNGEMEPYWSETLQCWVWQYYDTHGKRQTLKQRKKETKKQYWVRYIKIKQSLNDGTYISKSNDTICSLAENYIKQKHLDGVTSDRSYKRESETLAQIQKCCNDFCNKPIQKVTISEIEKSKEGIRKYSNNTISKIWALLFKTFKIAYSRRVILYNIMEDETLTKPISQIAPKKVKALTIEEEKHLEKVLLSSNHVYNNILLLQLYTGMRIGEVLALSKDCIDLKNNTLTVYRTITRDKNDKVILGAHTKTYNKKTGIDKGKRAIPLSLKTKKLLESILNNKLININNLIFWDYKKNTFITDGEINLYLDRLNNKEKITDRLHTHRLRHTFITRCQEKGIPLVVIQSLVGHVEGSNITNNVYTSVSLDFMEQELEKIN